MSRRVVVTGMGAITPIGNDVETFWNGLKEKKYDLGFCSKLDNEPLIEFIPVARQELVVIVPLDHPLAVKDEVRLEDTIPYKQIIFKKRSGLRQIIDGLFECIGQTPDVAYEIDEDQALSPTALESA